MNVDLSILVPCCCCFFTHTPPAVHHPPIIVPLLCCVLVQSSFKCIPDSIITRSLFVVMLCVIRCHFLSVSYRACYSHYYPQPSSVNKRGVTIDIPVIRGASYVFVSYRPHVLHIYKFVGVLPVYMHISSMYMFIFRIIQPYLGESNNTSPPSTATATSLP